MDLNRIERARRVRRSRESRPFKAFYEQFQAHFQSEDELSASTVSSGTKWLLQRAFVISVVTATEVYFRDMLDAIFRMCKSEVFLPKLRDLHKAKYDIDDLVSIYVHRVHPCELILDGLSFQRVDTVERVFSALLGKPFWKSVAPVQVRVKDEPSKVLEIKPEAVSKYGQLLQLRHQLIHNPDAHKRELSAEELDWLYETPALILACDLLLTSYISENIDPELKKEPNPQQCAAPNGGPATQLGNSGVTEGPPSMS
jgi:hypothetical protein